MTGTCSGTIDITIPPTGYSYVWMSTSCTLCRTDPDGYTYYYSGYHFPYSNRQSGVTPPADAILMTNDNSINPYRIDTDEFKTAVAIYGACDIRSYYPESYFDSPVTDEEPVTDEKKKDGFDRIILTVMGAGIGLGVLYYLTKRGNKK
jgi:hypothetical protein